MTGTRRRWQLIVGLACVGALSTPAFAADPPADIPAIEANVRSLGQRLQAVEHQLGPHAYTLDPKVADLQFRNGVYAYMTGAYERAAELFFMLEISGIYKNDPTYSREIAWHLASSLQHSGRWALAEGKLEAIAHDPQQPFRTDAIRVLLEHWADAAGRDSFTKLYQDVIRDGTLVMDDEVRYTLGRAFVLYGDRAKAQDYLSMVSSDSPFAMAARYHMGVLEVMDGSKAALDRAQAIFLAVASMPAASAKDKEIIDLAWLASARIHQSRNELLAAIECYGKVRADSPYRVEQLRELVWTFSRAERWEQAIAAADLFVLSFPDDPWVGEMRLVQAHLAYQLGRDDDALKRYNAVISELTPIIDKLRAIATDPERAVGVITDLVDGKLPADLPAYVMKIVARDPAMVQWLALAASVHDDRESVAKSDGFVEALEQVLGDGAGQGADPRQRALDLAAGLLRDQVAALRLERARTTLSPEVASAWEPRLDASVADIEAFAARVASLKESGSPEADLARVFTTDFPKILPQGAVLRDLSTELHTQGGVDESDKARFAALQEQIASAIDRLAQLDTSAAIDRRDDADFKRLAAMFEQEKSRLAEEKSKLQALEAELHQIIKGASVRAFVHAADELDALVAGAEKGSVNISWARWVATGDDEKRLKEGSNALISTLESRYGLILQRLGK